MTVALDIAFTADDLQVLRSFDRITKAAAGVGEAVSTTAARGAVFIASLQRQADAAGLARDELLAYQAAELGVSAAAAPLIAKINETSAALAREQAAAREAAEAERLHAAAQAQAAAKAEAFIDSLRRQADTLGMTKSQTLAYQAAQMGLSAQAAPFIARMAAVDNAVGKPGVSAAQTAAAMRMLPAQMTDVVTQLAGGQNPLLILIQQGGQVKDSFGGFGPMFSALGSYINPVAVGVGALAISVAAFSLAAHQGSMESQGFNTAIVMSGNAAGTTVGQLQLMAQNIDGIVGTQANASAALTLMAASGNVGSESLEQFTTTAIRMEREVGMKVSDTVEIFSDLAEKPLQATLKLNEKYHYLTIAVYEQIRALEQQGQTDAAAELAQKSFSAAMDERTAKLESSLGTIQRLWRGVTSFAAEAWDAMLGIGRQSGANVELAGLNASISAMQEQVDARRASGFNSGLLERELAGMRERRDLLQETANSEALSAAAQAEQSRLTQAEIAWDEVRKKSRTKAQIDEAEILKIRQLGKAANKDAAAIEVEVANYRESHKRSSAGAAAAYNDGINANIEALKRRGQVEDMADKLAIENLRARRQLNLVTDHEMIEGVAALEMAQLERGRTVIAAELAEAEKKKNSLRQQQSLIGQLDMADEKIKARQAQTTRELTALEYKRAEAARAVYEAQRLEEQGEIARDLVEQSKAREQARLATDAYSKSINEANAATAFELTLIGETTRDRSLLLESYRVELKYRQDIAEIDRNTGYDSDQRQAARQLAADIRDRALAGAAARADLTELDRMVGSIDQTAHDTWTNVWQSGSDAFKRVGKTLQSSVLDVLYQLTLKRWVISVSANLLGNSTGANALASAAGGGNSVTDYLSGGKSLYDVYTGAYNNALGSLSSSYANFATSSVGQSLGLGAQTAVIDTYMPAAGVQQGVAVTPLGSTVGAAAGIAGGVIGGIYGGRAISGGYSAIGSSGNTAVNTGTAIGAAVGTIVPVIGTAVGALVGGLLGGVVNRAFGRKAAEVTSFGFEGNAAASGFTGKEYQNWTQEGGWFRSDKSGVNTTSTSAELQGALDRSLLGLAASAGTFATNLGLSTDVILGYSQHLKVQLSNDEAANTAAITAALESWNTGLVQNLLPGIETLAKEGEPLGTTFVRLGTSIVQINELFGAMHLPLLDLSVASGDAASRFIDLFGGIDAARTAASSYYDAITSDAQKSYDRATRVLALIGGAGFDGNVVQSGEAMRAEYARITEAQDIATESGRAMKAQLMQGAEEFAAYTDELTATGDAAVDTASDLASARKTLEDQIFALRNAGNIQALRARDLAGTPEALRTLTTELWSLQDAADAAQAATQAAAAAQSERNGLEQRILQLLGNTSALRQRELSVLDASNRSLQERIYAVEDSFSRLDDLFAGLQRAVDARKSQIQAAYDAEVEAIQARAAAAKEGAQVQIDAQQQTLQSLRSIATALANAVKQVQVETAEYDRKRLDAADAILDQALTISRSGGSLAGMPGLDNALQVAGRDSKKFYRSVSEYQMAQLRRSAKIAELSTTADAQVSVADLTLSAIKAASDLAQSMAAAELKALEDARRADLAGLDKILADNRAELDRLKGIDTSVLTVDASVNKLTAQMVSHTAAITGGMAAVQAAMSAASAAAGAATAGKATGGTTAGGTAASGGAGGTAWGGGPNGSSMRDYTDQELISLGLDPVQVKAAAAGQIAGGAAGVRTTGDYVDRLMSDRLGAFGGLSQAERDKLQNIQLAIQQQRVSGFWDGTAPYVAPGASTPAANGPYVEPSSGGDGSGSAGERATTPVFSDALVRDTINGFLSGGASPAEIAATAQAHNIPSWQVDEAMGLAPGTASQIAQQAGLPAFAVGTNRVPRDMLALLHKDEAVVPRAFNPAAMGIDYSRYTRGGASESVLARAIEDLTAEVAELKTELKFIKANTGATSESSERTRKVLEGSANGSVKLATKVPA